MFKDAFNEIRLHPGRIVATLVAIAISVGFMAGAVTFIATVRDSTAKTQSLPLSRADVVITVSDQADAVLSAAQAQAGVEVADIVRTTQAQLSKGDASAWMQLYGVPSDSFRWASLTAGRWPSSGLEVALSPQAMKELDARLGDQLAIGSDGPKATVVGITDDPKQPFMMTGYGSAQLARSAMSQTVLVKARAGTDLPGLVTRLDAVAKQIDEHARAKSAADERQRIVNDMTGQFDVMKNMLLAFAVISLLVGMIIIANTFNILLAQRRRQVGLLRAVGASGAQVRRKFLAESAILGVLGSALGLLLGFGVAAIGAWFLGALHWGLTFPVADLAWAFGAGVVATVVSAVVPSVRATKVSPMEALQVVPSGQRAKRITIVRYVVCGLFGLAGAGLVFAALTMKSNNIVAAIGAGVAITIAVLGAAPIYVAPLISGLGRVFSFAGPTVRLAAANGARNPQRTAATATALMLAVGLIVTLQVGVSTMRTTTLEGIKNRYPVDIQVSTYSPDGLKPSIVDETSKFPGVKQAVAVQGGPSTVDGPWVRFIAPGDAMTTISPKSRQAPPDDSVAYVPPESYPENYRGELVTFTGDKGSVALKLAPSNFSFRGSVLVSKANLDKLVTTPHTLEVWYELTDRSQTVNAYTAFMKLSQTDNSINLGGVAIEAYAIEQVITIMLVVLTALLGVAVLIALVGVANTLGLSVIERKRESALLRALGMQKASLRLMLLVEALLIAVVGAGIGIAAGAFFGWLGTTSAYMMVPRTGEQPLVYSIDPLWTGGLLLVAVAAAALASVLPGRRAANATPTEALADE